MAERELLCIYPWMAISQESPGNRLSVCCWSKVNIKNVEKRSLEEIWNGPEYRYLRQKMLEGDIEKICKDTCPFVVNGKYVAKPDRIDGIGREYVENKRLMWKEIESGKVVISSKPTYVKLYPTNRCNLSCIMCRQGNVKSEHIFDKMMNEIRGWFKYMDRIEFVGGEPLLSKEVIEFVKEFDPAEYPDLKIHIITNGILLNKNIIDMMDGKFRSLSISVDGASKEVYESIRVGGKWEVLMKNMSYLAEKVRGKDVEVKILTVVMKRNIDDLFNIAAMAKNFGFSVGYQPISGIWHGQSIERRRDIIRAIRQLKKAQKYYPEGVYVNSAISDLSRKLDGGGSLLKKVFNRVVSIGGKWL